MVIGIFIHSDNILLLKAWNAVSKGLLSDNDPTNDLSPAACQRVWEWEHRRRPATDHPIIILMEFGGPVPIIGGALGNLRFFTSFIMDREMFLIPLTRDDYKNYNWSMKVNSDLSKDAKLMLTATTGALYTSAVNFEESYLNNITTFGIQNGVLPYNPTDYFSSSSASIAQMLTDGRDSKIYSDGWYSDVRRKESHISRKIYSVVTAKHVL